MPTQVRRKRQSMTIEPRMRRASRRPGGDTSRKHDDFLIVGVGASAGGLEALYKLIDALPPNPGMAFILVLHLDPTHSSMMVDLLTNHTAVTVSEAADGMPIARDRVYVIPPGVYLSIRDGTLRLTSPRERRGARMPIDFLLHSLAKDCGQRAVCVVLSGTGTDGSKGLTAVREQGGLVIVQEPNDAAQEGMPRSAIQTGAVDLVVPAAEIPAALLHHSQKSLRKTRFEHKPASASGIGLPLAEIIDLLHTHTSRDFALYKEGTLLRQIERRMAMAGISDASLYLDKLRHEADEIDRLAKDMLINVTQFFRDGRVFEVLAEKIIPELIDQQPLTTPIRIWDAGCSTGEETYSIAIVFLEAIASSKRNVKLQIFASDVDDEALTAARNGQYEEAI